MALLANPEILGRGIERGIANAILVVAGLGAGRRARAGGFADGVRTRVRGRGTGRPGAGGAGLPGARASGLLALVRCNEGIL